MGASGWILFAASTLLSEKRTASEPEQVLRAAEKAPAVVSNQTGREDRTPPLPSFDLLKDIGIRINMSYQGKDPILAQDGERYFKIPDIYDGYAAAYQLFGLLAMQKKGSKLPDPSIVAAMLDKKHVNNPFFAREAGNLLFEEGQKDKAFQFYEKSVALFPVQPDLFMKIADLYKERSLNDEAAAFYFLASVFSKKTDYPTSQMAMAAAVAAHSKNIEQKIGMPRVTDPMVQTSEPYQLILWAKVYAQNGDMTSAQEFLLRARRNIADYWAKETMARIGMRASKEEKN